MALINIEYGSVARSEVLNKNFLYLDEKIADSNTSTATNISSIFSNTPFLQYAINTRAGSNMYLTSKENSFPDCELVSIVGTTKLTFSFVKVVLLV